MTSKQVVTKLVLLVILALAPVAAAKSATIAGSEFAIGTWHGSARSGSAPDSGFSFCTVARDYPDGLQLSLARTAAGIFFIGVKNAAWQLSNEGAPMAMIGIDGDAPRSIVGVPVSHDTVLMSFRPDEGAIYAAMMSTGAIFEVASGGDRLHFDLVGVREALGQLADCVHRHSDLASSG